MPEFKRTVRILTEQKVIHDRSSGVEGFPLRKWNISLMIENERGEAIPATCFEKATYKLHPSFEARATQTLKKPPFLIEEEGWGEFDMEIVLTAVDKGGDHSVAHDLNFREEKYITKHAITFKNPKPGLLAILRESGSTGEENGIRRNRAEETPKKRKKGDKNIDMDKLADNLQRLGEDDLLQVVQMIHDHKSPDTVTHNNIEDGQFEVDLYTLPDDLVSMLWDFQKTALAAG